MGLYETLPVVLCEIPALSFESDELSGCSTLAFAASALDVLVSVGWKAVDNVRGYTRQSNTYQRVRNPFVVL